jgi:hypothetical protein
MNGERATMTVALGSPLEIGQLVEVRSRRWVVNEDYQLDTVFRAIQMPPVNLLIADDVGPGKTIESGLVALELIIRHRARRVPVVCPASLQVQWRDQMPDKFGSSPSTGRRRTGCMACLRPRGLPGASGF